MLASALALGSALGLGSSDYLGGIRSRMHGLLAVLAISQGTGFLLLLAALILFRPALPRTELIAAGLIAGAAEIVGTAALYRGLAVGITGIVAPTASAAPIVPLVIGVGLGLVPGPVQLIGVVLVVVGVLLASTKRDGSPTMRRGRYISLLWGIVAAAAFGLYLQFIGIASTGGILMTLFLARTAAIGILIFGATISRLCRRGSRVKEVRKFSFRDVPTIAIIGVIILVSDALYATSAAIGELALVAVLSSTHPVITILWSRIHGTERIGVRRRIGIVATVLGVIAITIS